MGRNGMEEKARVEMRAHIIGCDEKFSTVVADVLSNWFGIRKELMRTITTMKPCSIAIDARSGEVFELIDIIPKNQPPDKFEWYQAAIKTSEGGHITSDSRTLR